RAVRRRTVHALRNDASRRESPQRDERDPWGPTRERKNHHEVPGLRIRRETLALDPRHTRGGSRKAAQTSGETRGHAETDVRNRRPPLPHAAESPDERRKGRNPHVPAARSGQRRRRCADPAPSRVCSRQKRPTTNLRSHSISIPCSCVCATSRSVIKI